jgi:hypothetical protein
LGKREIGCQQSSRSRQQNFEVFHRPSDEPSSLNHFMESLSSQPFLMASRLPGCSRWQICSLSALNAVQIAEELLK